MNEVRGSWRGTIGDRRERPGESGFQVVLIVVVIDQKNESRRGYFVCR